ncbi:MAG TPA: succinate dehydrogenase cytochrome b subunit [Phnomibacter sp.]|nr:succinate dehydrogenase cytochrome b subunit [Phnomibacter sp.]
MTWKQVFTSSIGKKIVMGLTGIFLILFLIVHVGINACIFADLSIFNEYENGEMFNKAAHFMGSTVLIRILEVGLFAGIFLHIIQGLVLEFDNRRKRGEQGYAVDLGNKGSKWYSRSMGLLGTILLIFMIIHWWHFWIPARITGHEQLFNEEIGGKMMHNMFNLMQVTFSQLWVVVLYVLACISLAYHLLHGFQSAFRTLGLGNKKWMGVVQAAGFWYSIIVPLLFALMPIAMYLGWVGA